MSVGVSEHYNPRNAIDWKWTPNRELHVYGSGGDISSSNTIRSYAVTITYTGPVDIGDRTISKTDIPNYWRDPATMKQAEADSGVSGCIPTERETTGNIVMLVLFVCTSPFACMACIQNDRYDRYNASLERIANVNMGKHVARLVEAADSMIDERIRCIMQREGVGQSPIRSVAISPQPTFTLEQVQALLAQQQERQGSVPRPAGAVDSSTPLLAKAT